MHLKKFYTRPAKYFDPIIFRDGINYVYGYREKPKTPDDKSTLNNLGKSTFLDLIDFTLGSEFKKRRNPRLYTAFEKGFLDDLVIYLEFESGDDLYTVKRSFEKPNKVELKINNGRYKEYNITEYRTILSDLTFAKDNYRGYYSSDWFRRLLSFYITILKNNKKEYPDPFLYLEKTPELELLQYHLFLLNIDNRLVHDLFLKVDERDDKQKLVRAAVNNFISIHNLTSIGAVENKINHIKTEVEELQDKIRAYKLASSQKINADKAGELSKEINKLTFENFTHQQKIDTYNDSLKNDLSIRLSSIEDLYNEFQEMLGTKIKKELEEVVAFRKNLISSRRGFIESEIELLRKSINENKRIVEDLDNMRAEIFRILSTANAVKNISDSNTVLVNKEKDISNLEGQIKTYTVYSRQVSDLQQEISKLDSKIIDFRESIRNTENEFYKVFNSIYQQLYPAKNNASIFSFSIDSNSKVKSKLKIEILNDPEKHGKGKNRSRTLVYNLAVLFYSIHKNYNAPRFLIHDGVFDGIDKMQFVNVVKLLEEQVEKGIKFQYILALNEEGDFTGKIDPDKIAEHEKIKSEAIIRLTPANPLFKARF
jgi:uncharacterized protein YydD (DUF2326 family)